VTRRSFVRQAAGISFGLALGGCAGASSGARRGSSLLAGVEKYAHELVFGSATRRARAVACAYAAVDGSQHVAGAVGNLFRGAPPLPPARADSLFEIGSVTKVFTATLLAQTLQSPEHPIRLDSQIGRYLPDRVTDRRITELTFGDLASYSSCLIRVAPGQNSATYTIPELVRFLNQGGIRRGEHVAPLLRGCAPGMRYDYSNLGFGLLGYVLGRVWNTSWEDLITSNITGPLRMPGTVRDLDAGQLERLAVGYGPHGAEPPGVSAPFLGGGGILKSTANDMLRFLDAQLEPHHAPRVLRAAIPATHVNHHPGRTPAVGLGWFLDETIRRQPAFAKDGGTGGFGSYIAFVPDERRGAFLVTNTHHLTGGATLRSLLGFAPSGNGDAP
jgi:CubicO group peptidase (beta-lactamase class C family)